MMQQQKKDAETHIIEMLSSLNIILLKTQMCSWETPEFMSIDHWQFQNEMVEDKEIIIALQFSNSVMRQFCEGITMLTPDPKMHYKKEEAVTLYTKTIIDTSVLIRLECFNYLRHYSNPPHIELWFYEVINSLSNISGIMQSLSKPTQKS